jgi:hypothetical protein
LIKDSIVRRRRHTARFAGLPEQHMVESERMLNLARRRIDSLDRFIERISRTPGRAHNRETLPLNRWNAQDCETFYNTVVEASGLLVAAEAAIGWSHTDRFFGTAGMLKRRLEQQRTEFPLVCLVPGPRARQGGYGRGRTRPGSTT